MAISKVWELSSVHAASPSYASTAEGVETAEQLTRIRAEGYTEIQGYLVSKPLPAHEVTAMLLTQHVQTRAA